MICKPISRSGFIASLAVPLAVTLGAAGRASAQASVTPDSAAAVATVQKFHTSLVAGDSAAALALFTDGVQIIEAGGIEDRTHYREHHLAGDMSYAKAAPTQRTVTQVTIRGDVAWVVATSVTTGEVNGRAVNSQGAELMVLVRTSQGWKIAAVHWSSRVRRP